MRVKTNIIKYKDPETGEYIPIPAIVGEEDDLSPENIAEALGYTPASEEYVSHLSEEIDDLSELTTKLGNTPYTTEKKANIRLVADGECAYIIQTPTVAEWIVKNAIYQNCEYSEVDGHMELKSTAADGVAWYQNVARCNVGGLVIGETYNLIIDTLYLNEESPYSAGHFNVYSSDNKLLTPSEACKGNSINIFQFTATTEIANLRWHPAREIHYTPGKSVSRVNGIYINRASDTSYVHSGVFEESGSFTDKITFNSLPAYSNITTEKECGVYDVVYKEEQLGQLSELLKEVIVIPSYTEHNSVDVLTEYADLFVSDKFIKLSDGVSIVDNTAYLSTVEEFIDIKNVSRIFSCYFKTMNGMDNYGYIYYYDTNKNFIGYEKKSFSTETETFNGFDGVFYGIPTNAEYAKIAVFTNYYQGQKIFFEISEKIDGSVSIPNLIYENKQLADETIVCFGDSIFGYFRDETSVPSWIAKTTGADVVNVGCGGCRMSIHPTTGYAEYSMWALAKAITENDWTSQDAVIATGTGLSYGAEQIKKLKNLDFNKVSKVVIHYGSNDFTGSIRLDNESDLLDYTTFKGALRYSIEKLMTAYPHLRIYISSVSQRCWEDDGVVSYPDTYTNGSGLLIKDYNEALMEVAKEYALPYIDDFYCAGINKLNVAGFTIDNTHHNGIGRERLGKFIGSQILANQ